MERGEPVLCGGVDDLLPDHAGAGAHARGPRVDLDAPHPLGLEQDRLRVQLTEARGVVPGPLRRHAVAAQPREVDDGGDVLGRLGVDDDAGALVGSEVPGEASLVPAGIAREDDVSGDLAAELGGVEIGCQGQRGHVGVSSAGKVSMS